VEDRYLNFYGVRDILFGELVEHTQALAPRQAELVDSLPKVETGVTTTFTLMTPEVVKADLERFEGQFGITSREFLARFAAGAFDEREAISWEFACELADEMGIPYN